MPLHEAATSDDEWIADKQELAVLLGWSRPKLDRYIEANARFPVRQRGDRAGGWQFSVLEVFAFLGSEPPPRPGGSLKLDQGAADAVLVPLRPLGLPAVQAPAGRIALSEAEKSTVLSIIEAHNRLTIRRKKIAATLRSMFDAVEKVVAAEIMKVPDYALSPAQAQGFLESQVRMVGALMDITEARVLQLSSGSEALGIARRWFDDLRADLAEGFRESFMQRTAAH